MSPVVSIDSWPSSFAPLAARYARGLVRERTASANGADDSIDRSATDSRVVPVFKESRVCRAVGRLVNAVCRETCELILRCGPAGLLSKIGRQNEERLSAEEPNARAARRASEGNELKLVNE